MHEQTQWRAMCKRQIKYSPNFLHASVSESAFTVVPHLPFGSYLSPRPLYQQYTFDQVNIAMQMKHYSSKLSVPCTRFMLRVCTLVYVLVQVSNCIVNILLKDVNAVASKVVTSRMSIAHNCVIHVCSSTTWQQIRTRMSISPVDSFLW